MPCRIMIVEDDEGNRWLYTMAMELMLYGGKPLPDNMMKMAEQVRDLMYGMMDAAATGEDYEPEEDDEQFITQIDDRSLNSYLNIDFQL